MEDGRFSIDLSAGSRTSAVLQTLVVPAQSPRIIDIGLESKQEPYSNDGVEETFKKYGVSLDIVLMLVGNRGACFDYHPLPGNIVGFQPYSL
jgi:hypothetical protein